MKDQAKPEYANQWLKYEFTATEKAEIAERLAIKTQELSDLEDQKKSVMSSFKEKIDSCQTDINQAARKYKDGYEMRDIECVVERDFEVGEVRYIRSDNYTVGRVSKMTAAERQQTIDDYVG